MDADFNFLNTQFAEKTQQPEVFDCGNFNLLKVYQHALSYFLLKKPLASRAIFQLPFFLQNLALKIRRWKYREVITTQKKQFSKLREKKYLLYSGGNYLRDENENVVSGNTHHLRQVLNEDVCCFIHADSRGKADINQNMNISEIMPGLKLSSPMQETRELVAKVRHTRSRMISSGKFEPGEQKHFDACAQVFIDDFNAWIKIFHRVKPEKIFIICHYHNEGLVAAARHQHIKVVELQHGLISQEDYYYVYHDAVKRVQSRALFADRILLFGNFWKHILLRGAGYAENQMAIIGRYQFHPKPSQKAMDEFRSKYLPGSSNSSAFKHILFVACQKQMTEFYAGYINRLALLMAERHPQYCIIVKPHPLQQRQHLLDDCRKNSNVILADKYDNLLVILAISSIQVSVYSTTLYDAIGHRIANFSIQDYEPRAAYARQLVAEGIAFPLLQHEDPVEKIKIKEFEMLTIHPEEVYAPFRTDFIQL
ncbi:MAG: hypothetical protein SH856_07260 [Flavobacteriales bacterium]|nr:hypothetical protein [Flavobacteriales bacterium]